MKNKKNIQSKTASLPPQGSGNNRTWIFIAVLIVLTFFSYKGALKNELTNWDDKNYIIENKDITQLNKAAVNKAFKSYVMGNYHPLTMLSYNIEYHFFKLDPKPYHVTNLFFHILNTILVFIFIRLLSKQNAVAFITALLFALHPMHVESVAWVSERKDVFYTFFFFSALCVYMLYLKENSKKAMLYVLIFFLFILSLLSKAMAVTLPVVFLLVDYFTGRKISIKVLLEKIPFFIVSVIFGIIAIYAQKAADAIGDIAIYSFFDRILLTCYGITLYLWKLIAPLNLSCFYDYPLKDNGSFPAMVYLSPLIIGGLLFLLYKNRKQKHIVFGSLFFLVTIALVLQILPVGGALIAERYTYIPYVGFFFIAALFINKMMENKPSVKPVLLGLTSIIILACAFLTVQRCKIWKDSITLWNNAIEQFDKVPKAYNGRGDAYNLLKKYDLAIVDFNRAIELRNDYPDALYNRGLSYYYLGNMTQAINDYTLAIKYNPNLAVAYFNRSGTFYGLQKNKMALQDALKSKELGYDVDPKYIEALQENIKRGLE